VCKSRLLGSPSQMTSKQPSRSLVALRVRASFLMVALLTPAASALSGSPIFVSCAISSGSTRSIYGEGRVNSISPQLCADLIARLRHDPVFSLWDYGTAGGKGGPSLMFVVFDDNDDPRLRTSTLIKFSLTTSKSSTGQATTWLYPGDAHPATADDARCELNKAIGALLQLGPGDAQPPPTGKARCDLGTAPGSQAKSPWRKTLEDGLKEIPVAHGRWLGTADPSLPKAKEDPETPLRIVSSIPWDKHPHLENWWFRINCPQKGSNAAVLVSRVRPTSGPWPPDAKRPYPAVVLIVKGMLDENYVTRFIAADGKNRGQFIRLNPGELLYDDSDSSGVSRIDAYHP
jgi:hypothetical protein